MSVLGRMEGYIQAIVRYVEAKCLLGGVTTSQGIRLYSNPNAAEYYRGLIRNVEETDDENLPEAKTRVADVDAQNATKFLKRLKKSSTLLLHLSEGLGERARKHFKALKIKDRNWAITEALAGIHCTGLRGRDFATLRSRGGTMVWSPFSNLLLYGDTADIARANEEGVTIALGSDWSPTGSKNLLAEMKTAHLVSQQRGGVFSARDIVEMATLNAAKILKWQSELGSIEPNKRADFVVLNGRSGDPYEQVLEARETSITLVVINGVPRYGQSRMMRRFKEPTETWHVDGSDRDLYLEQETANVIVGKLTLAEARDRLEDGMRRLPELAAELENPDTAVAAFGTTLAERPGRWFLDLDHGGGEGYSLRPQLPFDGESTGIFAVAAAAQPLSQLLQPVKLDPLTVLDDKGYFQRLADQRNLPAYIKENLAPLYGQTAPSPGPSAVLVASPAPEPEDPGHTTGLHAFLEASGALTLSERKLIVDQSLLLMAQVYVHLELKRSMYAVDPVQSLRLLRDRLSRADEESLSPSSEFHHELTEIFNSVRDLHTNYLLPSPFRECTAFLPFIVEEYFENGMPKYMVTKVAGDLEHPTFRPGVEILYWNGVPTRDAIRMNSEQHAGSNEDARFARRLASLTIRPLVRLLPPREE